MNTNIIAAYLVNNYRAGSKTILSKELLREDYQAWKDAMQSLLDAAYDVRCQQENDNLRNEDKTTDKTAVYTAVRNIFAIIGEVNGYKMYANCDIVDNVIAYAARKGTEKSDELKSVEKDIKDLDKLLETWTEGELHNQLKQKRAELLKKKSEVESEDYAVTRKPKRVSPKTFTADVENRLARAIDEQLIKTREQLAAEEAARKEARKEAARKRNAAKRANKKK